MGIDTKLAKREERALLRIREEENRRAIYKAHRNSDIDDDFINLSEEWSDDEGISCQPGLSSSISQSLFEKDVDQYVKSKMETIRGRKCFFLTPKLMAMLDRCSISQRKAVFIIEAVTESLRHNIDELSINRKTMQRYREDFRKTKATRFKELLQENEPSFVFVHWDGKLLPALNVRVKRNKRLPIIITYKNEEKLLGVPKLENSTGKEQAMAVWNVLKKWG